MQYRREVDGLRAVAVIPVILFHAGFTVFSGGYVGVDIFFVISGYLITSIIIGEMEQGRFSLLRFYERRARRILPALFLVMSCCIPFAWMWMFPSQIEDFSQSLIAVIFFASNILFWRESGYFEAASEDKPLLHTWSLAVEEQYYMFFPLFLILLWRFGRRPVFYSIIVASVISLLLSEWGWRNSPTANFYLAPTRAWELLAGSLCAFLQYGKAQRSSNMLSASGFALILFAIFFYDKNTPIPSVYALAPVAGTALILMYGTKETWIGRLLSLKGFVGIGLISYSAYLWHQPLFAFARLRSLFVPEQWLMVSLSILSLVLAYLSWRFVEQPFRKPAGPRLKSQRTIFGLSGIGAALFISFGFLGTWEMANTMRFGKDQLAYLDHFENDLPDWAYFEREGLAEAFRDDCNFYDLEKYRAGDLTTRPVEHISASCFTRNPDRRHAVFIWGDSHAQMLNAGLTSSLPDDWQVMQVASSGCKPELRTVENRAHFCEYANWFASQVITKDKPDVVIIGQQNGHDVTIMNALAEGLEKLGVGKVIFSGPVPQWTKDLPKIIVGTLWENTPARTSQGLVSHVLEADARIKRDFTKVPGRYFISLVDVFCNEKGCITHVGEDRKTGVTSWDYGHLTPIASRYLADRVLAETVMAEE